MTACRTKTYNRSRYLNIFSSDERHLPVDAYLARAFGEMTLRPSIRYPSDMAWYVDILLKVAR